MRYRFSAFRAFLWTGAAVVVAWRLAAVRWPHAAGTDPEVVKLAMAPLGLLFVGCGLWAFQRSPGPPTRLFALYGLTSGLHWGGPLGIGSDDLQTFELVLYLVVSSLLSQTLLLHLALVFPRRLAVASRPIGVVALYMPAMAGAVIVFGLLLLPGSFRGTVQTGVPILLLVGTLYTVTAALVWIVRLIASPRDRRDGRLALLVPLLLASALPYILVSAMGPFSELDGLFNLFVALEPLAFAFVLTRAG